MAQNKKPFGPLYQEAVIAYAREEIGLNFGTVSVLRALVSFTNGETGQARPGVTKIIERAGCSEKTVERALKVLRDTEVIRPLAYAKGGRGCATVYGFALPAWSGQPRKETTDNMTGENKSPQNINHRQIVPKPPTNWGGQQKEQKEQRARPRLVGAKWIKRQRQTMQLERDVGGNLPKSMGQ